MCISNPASTCSRPSLWTPLPVISLLDCKTNKLRNMLLEQLRGTVSQKKKFCYCPWSFFPLPPFLPPSLVHTFLSHTHSLTHSQNKYRASRAYPPPTGNLGLPVTNWRNSLCCSLSKLLRISNKNFTARLQEKYIHQNYFIILKYSFNLHSIADSHHQLETIKVKYDTWVHINNVLENLICFFYCLLELEFK